MDAIVAVDSSNVSNSNTQVLPLPGAWAGLGEDYASKKVPFDENEMRNIRWRKKYLVVIPLRKKSQCVYIKTHCK